MSDDVAEVDRSEILRRLHDPGLVLLDVRSPEAFRAGRIRGARNLPVSAIREHARSLLPQLEADLLVYCGGFS